MTKIMSLAAFAQARARERAATAAPEQGPDALTLAWAAACWDLASRPDGLERDMLTIAGAVLWPMETPLAAATAEPEPGAPVTLGDRR